MSDDRSPDGGSPEIGPASSLRRRLSAGVLGERDFLRLWLGQSASQLGSRLSAFALPVLAVTTLHAGPGEMGALTAAETIAFLLLGLPAGAWVDRWARRRILLWADVARAVLFATIPLAWALDALTLTQLLVVAVLTGVATVFFDVAYQSFLPALVRPEQLVEGNARLQASESVTYVAGPAVGGLLLRVVSAPVLMGLDALSYLVSVASLTRIAEDGAPPAPEGARRRLREEVGEGLRFVVRHPLISRISACTSLSNLFGSMAGTLVVLLLVDELGQSPSSVGLAFAVGSAGTVLAALTADWWPRRLGEGRAILAGALVCGGAAFLLPLAAVLEGSIPPLAVVAAGEALFGVGVVVYNVTQVSFRQRVCPPALLGRMNASIRFLVWGTMPVGAVLAGALGSAAGVVPTLWIAAVGQLLAALPVLLSPLRGAGAMPVGGAGDGERHDDGEASAP